MLEVGRLNKDPGNESDFAEVIEDPERIRELLSALVRHGAPASLLKDGRTIPLKPVAFGDEVGVIRWEIGESIAASPFEVCIVGHNAVFSFIVRQAFQNGRHLVTPIAKVLRSVRRRWERRRNAVESLRVQFSHPESGEVIAGRVADVSFCGLGLLPGAGPRLPEGAIIPELQLLCGDGESIRMQCEVRFALPRVPGGMRYGLRVHRVYAHDTRWFNLVSDSLYPGTQVGSAWDDAMWSLYHQSGYFNLSGKEPEDFSQSERAFKRVCQILDSAPQLGVHAVWPRPDSRDLVAAYTGLKVYSGTWLTFQLAKITGAAPGGVPSGTVLHEIHSRVFEHAQRDPALRWMLVYAQDKPTWSRYVYRDVPTSKMQSADSAITKFYAIEVSVGALSPTEAIATIDVATPHELHIVSEHIAASRGGVYADALDLTQDTIDLRDVSRLWNGSQMERERIVIVAREQGVPVAAAVLELGAEGAHLYGLIDLVRVFALSPGGEAHFDALLDAGATWYERHGRARFVSFIEDEDYAAHLEKRAGVTNLGAAHMFILPARRVPEWLECLHEVTAPRAATAAADPAAPIRVREGDSTPA